MDFPGYTRPSGARRRAFAACLLFLAGFAPALALTTAEEAGRRIYEDGVSPSGGTILARLGAGAFEVPGTAAPCANCHGADGTGRPEGAVVPPNIRWSELAKPYGHVHPDGRKHPAFDEIGLRKAVTRGVDPAGNELDPAMPRYRMSDEDVRSLVTYLKRLEFQLPPGVGANSLRIGTVLPMSGRFADIGRALRGVLEASFARVNGAGGLYGRKLELVVADYGDGPESAYANAWAMLRSRGVFVLLAPFSAGWERDLGRIAAEEKVPVIAPVTLFPEDARASNLYVFHLLSGVTELAEVLASHAAQHLGAKDRPAVILHADRATGAAQAEALDAHLAELGWGAVLPRQGLPAGTDVAALARSLHEKGVYTVFLLAAGTDLAALARAGEEIGWHPYLLLPGALAPRDILDLPRGFDGRVFLAYPTLPGDLRAPAAEQYAALFEAKAAVRGPQALQVPAYAGALVLTEVLKQIGRDVSRQKFSRALEGLQGFDTGMLPPLTYNADRRIGVLGGYVVGVDLEHRQFRPLGRFVPLQ